MLARGGIAPDAFFTLASVHLAIFRDPCLQVLDFVMLGSTMSLRSWARCGSGLSVLDLTFLGSALSLRSAH